MMGKKEGREGRSKEKEKTRGSNLRRGKLREGKTGMGIEPKAKVMGGSDGKG